MANDQTVIEIILKAVDNASSVVRSASSSISKSTDKIISANTKGIAETERFTDSVLNFSKKAIIGFGLGTAAVVGFGLKTAGQLESARQGFVTLLGSVDKADEVLKQIKIDAAATPFELTGLIAANQALTSVTKDGQRSEQVLLNVGKALAASGKGQVELDRIIANLQQIGLTGDITAMDIRQFGFAGVNVLEILADYYGTTTAKAVEMVKDSKDAFADLEGAFNKVGGEGGRFANAFINQAGAWNQLVSNMKDVLVIFSSDLVKNSDVFDMAKGALTNFLKILGENRDDLIDFGTNVLKSIIGGISGLVNSVINLIKWWNRLSDGQKNIIEMFGKIVLGLAVFTFSMGIMIKLVEGLAGAFSFLISSTGIMIKLVEGLAGAFSFLISSTGLAIAAMVAVGAIGAYLITHWDQLKAKAIEVWDGIKAKINESVQSVVTFFQNLWTSTVEIWDGIKTAFTSAIDSIIAWFLHLPTAVGEAIGYMWGKLLVFWYEQIPAFIEGVINWFSTLPERVMQKFNEWTTAISTWWEGFKAISSQKATETVESTVSFFTGLPERVSTWFNNTKEAAKEAWDGFVEAAGEWGSNLVESIMSAIKGLPDKVREAFNSAKENVSGFFGGVWDKVKGGITMGKEAALQGSAGGGVLLPGQQSKVGEAGVERITALPGGGVRVDPAHRVNDGSGVTIINNNTITTPLDLSFLADKIAFQLNNSRL